MSDQDKQLEQLLNTAREQIAPERDLWPGIQARIHQEKNQTTGKRSYRPALAIAALLLACLMFGWQLTGPMSQSVDPALITLVESTRQQHKDQLSQLQQAFRPVKLQPSQAQQAIEMGAEQLKGAEQQVYQELLKAPDNQSLWEMWLWLHRQEIELQLDSQQVSSQPQGAQI
ncbi:hypothetical protein L2725_19035 [Shewanella corallii]|uniref:Anti-sigma factor n=1 Tax=Shewanella corallii TaxID=560080 RepID=A0ABT0NBN5_9GAMM|nr:hypothetical protein [Shewanella corallii]MCL2915843.1 hypothetical protein [Shewanella corallii]